MLVTKKSASTAPDSFAIDTIKKAWLHPLLQVAIKIASSTSEKEELFSHKHNWTRRERLRSFLLLVIEPGRKTLR
jgi:hypothetical protein